MKQIRIISRYLQVGIILFFLAACNDEYMPDGTTPQETSDGVLQIELFTNADEFEKPVTRAAATDENSLQGSMPWILVFRGDNNNAVFFEVSRAILSNGKLAVPLTKTNSKSRLIIITNPPAKFFDGATDNLNLDKTIINAALSGKTYGQALSILNTQKLSSPQITVPYAGGYLPMSASRNLNSINEQTTIGTPLNKVQLKRIVAKVTVENTATGFTLEGFTVVGAKQYGRLSEAAPIVVGNKVNYFAQLPKDPVSGISNGKTPVYIYESSVGETSVIVKGKYNGETSYYRLAFKNSNNAPMSIARNKWYQFNIKNVKIAGYKTPQDAIVAPPSNIMAELLVIDQSSMEITDNGQYYIGMSNSEFYVYSNAAQNNLTAITITTNAPAGTLTKIEAVSVNPANSMTISSGNIVPDGTVKGMDVKVNLTSLFTTGTMRVTVGNLVRTVKVERKPIISWQETKLTFSPGYVSAKIESQGNGGDKWLTLSTDGIKYSDSEAVHPDSPGTIYLKVSNNGSGNLPRSGGVIYLGRKNSEGHVKLYVNQVSNIPR